MNIKTLLLILSLLLALLNNEPLESKPNHKYVGFEFDPQGPETTAMLGVLEHEKNKIFKLKCQAFKDALESIFYKGENIDPYMCNTRYDYTQTNRGEFVEKYDRLYWLTGNDVKLVDQKSVPEGFNSVNPGNQYGCLMNYRVFAQDINLDGLEEIFWFYGNVYESSELYKSSEYLTRYEIDLHIYDGKTLKNIISADFVDENYQSEQYVGSETVYQASAFPDVNTLVPYKDRKPSYRHLAKLYVADLDKDGLNNILIWHRNYESRLKTDSMSGFKFMGESFSHWEETTAHRFEKQSISNVKGQNWLADNGFTWKDGFPEKTFCNLQPENKPVILQRVIKDFDAETGQPIYDDGLNLNDPVIEK